MRDSGRGHHECIHTHTNVLTHIAVKIMYYILCTLCSPCLSKPLWVRMAWEGERVLYPMFQGALSANVVGNPSRRQCRMGLSGSFKQGSNRSRVPRGVVETKLRPPLWLWRGIPWQGEALLQSGGTLLMQRRRCPTCPTSPNSMEKRLLDASRPLSGGGLLPLKPSESDSKQAETLDESIRHAPCLYLVWASCS